MPRPTSKNELQDKSIESFNLLNALVDSFSAEELEGEFPTEYMNRNIRDVLAHLHHWHLLFLDWHKIGMAGGKPDMPSKGYTWKDLPSLNREIRERYRTEPLQEIRGLLHDSFLEVQKIIDRHSNEELFEKQRYRWTGITSLGAYLVSVTSSHYDWALKLLKNHQRNRKPEELSTAF